MLINGDCYDALRDLPDSSIQLVLCDPPYGIVNWTNPYKWDNALDLPVVFKELKRIVSPKGAILLFGTEPYSSFQRNACPDLYKYDIVWEKNKVSSPMLAKVKPLRSVELISVFSKGTTSPGRPNNMVYNPQGLVRINKTVKNSRADRMTVQNRPSMKDRYVQEFTNYPRDIVKFDCETGLHPTQKPVGLLEYLIRTYSNASDTVLDFTMGSGSTGVAAENSGRKFIGVERDAKYFEIAKRRIEQATLC